ncbi:MAG: single-stranded DNA-binding protein [Anaerolineales bacterium]|nr:single-stranded DNA-binding protein [Anaerolineales bacterium]MCB8953089.1 single-stranded DNA-binding protein [Ardenticatenales bacterium]
MYQKLTLVGNLGQDPELRYLSDGQPVANFSLACNRRWNDRHTGQQQEEAGQVSSGGQSLTPAEQRAPAPGVPVDTRKSSGVTKLMG